MDVELVGGASLYAFLQIVLDKLASTEVVNLIRGEKKLLQKLKTTLIKVGAVLDDAEKKQIAHDRRVNNWLNDIKNAVYEVDDLLDELSTKAVTQKQVSNWFSHFLNNKKMASKLEDIVDRLEYLLELKEDLGLKEVEMEMNVYWQDEKALPTTSLNACHIYGRDKDKEAIIKLLLEDTSDGKEVAVILIVGVGGIGKTTLAQSVYNDDNLYNWFDCRAWVYGSKEFDIFKITKTVMENITGKPCEINDLNLLRLGLMEKLAGKRFLIVLDDVWTEDYLSWSLHTYQHGARGSKILVTARNENIATIIDTVKVYHLDVLSDEDCWFVFAEHAWLSIESNERTTALVTIGREIVKKCNGLPLAAQSLGRILRSKHHIEEWYNILFSELWDIPDSLIPALGISYHYLSPQLKRCFVYCSLYPIDYEFWKEELILLWMAEGLLNPQRNGKTLEETGDDYFDDLVSRSFFQPSTSWPQHKCFVMHQYMHNLATFLGGEFYFRSEELQKVINIRAYTRHLSFTKFDDIVLDKVKFLRTFLPINFKDAPFDNENAPCIIMSKLKYLRVLSFCGFQSLNALPGAIGKLIHLRYLNLSYTCVETLPESVCSLYNLQTLKLSNCRKLTMLPSGMQNLVNLRHLSIHCTSIKEMPRGMGKLNNLQHLDSFIVGQHQENGIRELGGLLNLHGPLSIINLENVTKSDEALKARIMDKKHINSLSLEWSKRHNNSLDFQIEVDVLCKLQPHQDLVSLSISGYKGTRFPDWVGNFSYYNMTHLRLCNCNNCRMLPSLGQLPSLKDLYISCLNSVKIIGASLYKTEDCSFVKPFSSLESLTIHNMPCWEAWISFDLDAFPLLKDLEIDRCPNLRGGLPNHLPALESLTIKDCKLLVSSLPRAPALRRLKIRGSKKVRLHEFPILVESLEVEGSPMVTSMIEAISNIKPSCLQSLTLSDCSSAISFSGGGLPASLKSLNIWGLKKLEFPTQHKHELLESLEIHDSCDSLISLPLIIFPNLKRLVLVKCENMESLLVSLSESSNNLSSFEIRDCPNFVSFPREGLPAPNLIRVTVDNCDKLNSLPEQMSTLLPKLQYLHINDCSEIESFPEGGMPPNLRLVWIDNCKKLLRGIAWPSMRMLTSLYVQGPCYGIKSFPKEGLLPPSLTSLHLFDFSSLETLDCEGLIHLTSLQELEINSCQKLENMAGERLPASLIKLSIHECPILQERCHKKHKEIWPKISHIHGIVVGSRS
ncbi:putative disease resistance protein At3g14460 [Glycine soja]|uniref:Putative disease resistance RPP13-like protein 1 isoform A n=2 Tax=Glycine soja TaxID=3848 RepID=A0A445L8V5_GLYSO|nr:putative disease resistance protein At3g14460 [Glycine soja]XP_028224728.1 putative disease resistance protein At3g14460 [Glycine soja]XP_028224729.1 putative disease resistance protein At3g14460 [Glycine soja]XP_028224730.1 putative disease resistance protein At3g14460 [Glycine soja]XP_028224731.1 putative disease resistance protein At3g14460 [Glycine soja]XP_028224732.1 putative disease resistance protein At3g14460 [Glycine soja]RZC19595.1 putative disease resistance RPP13-like protein 1